MQAGEEEKHGNILDVKRGVVAGAVAASRVDKLQAGAVRLLKDLLEYRRGADTADVEFGVARPAHHVEIKHGHGALERPERVPGVVGLAHERQLLARKRDEDNAALQVAPPCRERRSQLEDCGSAGGAVVGAGVDLANLRGSEGIVLAQAEVVVVRADDDSFVGELRVAPAQNADHVLRRGGYVDDLHPKSESLTLAGIPIRPASLFLILF